jgi:hypothetical protein
VGIVLGLMLIPGAPECQWPETALAKQKARPFREFRSIDLI